MIQTEKMNMERAEGLAASLVPHRDVPHTPLRIMHVVNSLGRGGTEFGVLKLIAALKPESFEHRLCTTRHFDPEFVRTNRLEKIMDVAGRSDPSFQFPFFRLKRIFERHRPHIVHTRNWGALEAVPAARLAGVPIVIHSEHGYEVEMLQGMPMRRRMFRRFVYMMTDAVLAVTRELGEYHARQAWIRPESFRVIYNGVDTDRFSPSQDVRNRLRCGLGVGRHTFLIGGVGRMVSIKDYRTLLRAVESLVTKDLDARVLLVGDGSQLEALRTQVRESAHLGSRVTFTGASDRIPEFLNAMDAFVLPSLGEGMSNTLLEAMAVGLPLVATRVGGNPEVIEDGRCGFFFSPGDATHLAQLLEQLCIAPKLRDSMSTAARERAILHFSLGAMVRRYEELYLEHAQRRSLLRMNEMKGIGRLRE